MDESLGTYILDDEGNPVIEDDILRWSAWFATADRQIVDQRLGHVRVSTVFLGIDHGFSGENRPILYETMVFGGRHDGYQDRYASKEEAVVGHAEIVSMVRLEFQ